MRSDAAAAAATTVDRGPSRDNCAFGPPDPSRRLWRRSWPGTGFLDLPGGAEYANRWLMACGQGG